MQLLTTILALTATLAAAAPAASPESSRSKLHKQYFYVDNFSFGCTVTCDWSFHLTVGPTRNNHPEVKKPVTCRGNLDAASYVDCDRVSNTQTLRAYIERSTNLLKLQYQVNNPEEGSSYFFEGDKQVYSETGKDAKKQKDHFKVKETRVRAIA